MDELSKQDLGVTAKVGLVLLFKVILLLIIEVPLVGYFVSPDGTDAAIRRFRDFLSRDGHRILLIGGTVPGLLLLARGNFSRLITVMAEPLRSCDQSVITDFTSTHLRLHRQAVTCGFALK
jgi:hypothetical protein